MSRRFLAVVVPVLLGCWLELARVAVAGTHPDDGLDHVASACDQKIDSLKTKIERLVLWSSIFTIAGAIVAGTGSALAGFLGNEGQRRAAAVVGALGAVLSVMPKVLPDQEALHKSAAAADAHRVLGQKVRAQLPFARAEESTIEGKKYASARFVDCAAFISPEAVPELPVASASSNPPGKSTEGKSDGAKAPSTTTGKDFVPRRKPGSTKMLIRKTGGASDIGNL